MVLQWIFTSSIFLIAVVAIYICSLYKNPEKTECAALYVFNNIFDIFVILISIAGLMSLVEVLIPEGFFMQALSSPSKILLTAIGGTFLGSITTGPPILSYPIAKAMLDEGVKLGIIAGFISAWSLMDPISLPVEIRYLGKKFAFWRLSISFLLALSIGVVIMLLL